MHIADIGRGHHQPRMQIKTGSPCRRTLTNRATPGDVQQRADSAKETTAARALAYAGVMRIYHLDMTSAVGRSPSFPSGATAAARDQYPLWLARDSWGRVWELTASSGSTREGRRAAEGAQRVGDADVRDLQARNGSDRGRARLELGMSARATERLLPGRTRLASAGRKKSCQGQFLGR